METQDKPALLESEDNIITRADLAQHLRLADLAVQVLAQEMVAAEVEGGQLVLLLDLVALARRMKVQMVVVAELLVAVADGMVARVAVVMPGRLVMMELQAMLERQTAPECTGL